MGNQNFSYVIQNGQRRLMITTRLYNEIIADTNGLIYSNACAVIRRKLSECTTEVKADTTGKKVSIEI
jgi:hypothetical protein